MKYLPQTPADIREMLDRIGARSTDDLYADVPEDVRFSGDYDLPSEMSEVELRRYFEQLGSRNRRLTCFAGAGVYDHYTPAVIPQIVGRAEMLTAYTPYQAEISQGTLHYIFEWQSMVAELTGMEVANASLYDGTTATAEAAMMAVNAARKARRVLMSETVDPRTQAVVRTYAHFHGFSIEMVPEHDGATDRDIALAKLANADDKTNPAGGIAALIVQQPNRYGIVEDFAGLADAIHQRRGLLIVNSVIADLALLKSPGEWDADIAVGEAQSLGLPMNFGGPYLGYMATRERLMRKMPGRIVGQTVDQEGRRVFVLTLQAREQHIRRQKATSNICSNESLMALWATVYMSLMGREGLKEAAQTGVDGAHYLYGELLKTGRFEPVFRQPFFNEFCLRLKQESAAHYLRRMEDHGILAGVALSDDVVMMAVTEQRTRQDVELLISLSHEQ